MSKRITVEVINDTALLKLREAMAKAQRALTASVANFNKAATAFSKAHTLLNVIKNGKQNDSPNTE